MCGGSSDSSADTLNATRPANNWFNCRFTVSIGVPFAAATSEIATSPSTTHGSRSRYAVLARFSYFVSGLLDVVGHGRGLFAG